MPMAEKGLMKSRINPTKQAGKRRVLIVDDHAVLREGLALVINVQPDLLVCGEAANVAGGREAVDAVRPDIALIDLSLMGGNGLELVKDLKTQHPDLPTLVLSLHDEALYAERVLH